MKKSYDILGLSTDATWQEIEHAYKKLCDDYNPKNNDNQDFFVEEYKKINEAYIALKKQKGKYDDSSEKLEIKSTKQNSNSKQPINMDTIAENITNQTDEGFDFDKGLTTAEDDSSDELDFGDSSLSNSNFPNSIDRNKEKKLIRFFKHDDEYISGSDFVARFFLNLLLSIFVVGIYLQSVTAYKRAKSIGLSNSSANFWGFWGIMVLPLCASPETSDEIPILIFVWIPFFYLCFMNGKK